MRFRLYSVQHPLEWHLSSAMVNVITPNIVNNSPTRVTNQSSAPLANTPKQTAISTNTIESNRLQWGKIESNTSLNSQQKQLLQQLNPELGQQLNKQINHQSANLSQASTTLQQHELRLLQLRIDNTLVRIVIPQAAQTQIGNLATGNVLPIIQVENGWQLATQADLGKALKEAATQLLKQNLPVQTPTSALFKVAHAANNENTLLAHLPKTQSKLQGLLAATINPFNSQALKTTAQHIGQHIKPNHLLNQIETLKTTLQHEIIQTPINRQNTDSSLKQLNHSLVQLQQAATTSTSVNSNNISKTIGDLHNQVQQLLGKPAVLSALQVTELNRLSQKVVASSSALNSQTSNDVNHKHLKLLEQALGQLTQQIGHIIKPFNSINTQLNSPVNAAILQLLGMATHGQPQDQQVLQQHAQQQLKRLLERVGAHLTVNQLRHLGLDTSKELSNTAVQQLQGELPFRLNEQLFNISYMIQGFDEQENQPSQQEPAAEQEVTKETTRRWQIFMSLDLPDNEVLHCKLNIINQTISTTLWAESETLCRTTQKALSDLEKQFINSGFTIELMQCLHGSPPQDETSLSYHLVDINT